MLRIILLLAVMLAGCNSTDSGSDAGIAPGTYQHQISASDGTGIIQWQFKGDGTYLGKGYITLFDGSADCQFNEGMGSWTATATVLKTSNKKARSRSACNSEFSEWESRPDSDIELRNVTPASLELFQASDSDSPATWLKFQKL